MRSAGAVKSKFSFQVGLEHVHLIHIGNQLAVHSLLGSLSGISGDSASALGELLGSGLALEEVIIDGRHIHTIHRHLGAGGNAVSLVHAAKRDTVQGVGT